jgi:hypothetical protein
MSVYANESKAWTRATGYVILKGAREVARIYVAHPAGGAGLLRVTCFQHSQSAEKSAAVLAKIGRKGAAASARVQHGSAGGYGYDKKTAALSGLVIDGHQLSDHCGMRKKAPRAGFWPRDAKAPRGWRFANWDTEKGGYADCYRSEGLRYLQEIGYTVIEL